MKTVFIDGSAGTTGIQIFERLAERDDIKLNILSDAVRKDPEARKQALNESDIAFFCLPDAAAIEAAGWCENPDTVIIDTSTAHRCDADWTYGFPELHCNPAGTAFGEETLKSQIQTSKRIANPGCHASGFIALAAPLVQAGLIPADALLTSFSLTGYSGGGRKMIEEYEGKDLPEGVDPLTQGAAFTGSAAGGQVSTGGGRLESPRQYGLTQSHKHLPEMMKYSGLAHAPAFCPVVAAYRQGMEVTIPIFTEQLDEKALTGLREAAGAAEGSLISLIQGVYADYYKGRVVHFTADADESGFAAAGRMAGRDDMEIAVFGNEERILLVSRFDNLGKGACGAAIQNMNLVLGIDETTGLNLGDMHL